MPIYLYQHPKSEDIIEVLQGMNDIHEYIDDENIKWNRIFTSPNAFIDLESDPFSNTQFIEKTANAGTMGEMWDRSADMSSQRASKNGGVDPMREKYFKDYSKKRAGAEHLSSLGDSDN